MSVQSRPGRGRCALAEEPLAPGTPVGFFSGTAYACCPLPSERERWCAACFKQAPPAPASLLRCSKCKWARYCSRSCQASDWPHHKHECPALAAADSPLLSLNDAPSADLLLLGRCLWRRHDASSHPTAEDEAFDALEPGPIAEQDRALALLATQIDGLLPPVARGPEATNGCAAAAAWLLGCFKVNNFGLLNEMHSLVGAGCYPNTAILNHSCAPNCILAFNGSRIQVRTCVAVAKGEELSHSYVELCRPTAWRQMALRETYGFDCSCPRCVTPLFAKGVNIDIAMEGFSAEAGTHSEGQLQLAAAMSALSRAAEQEDEVRHIPQPPISLDAMQIRANS